MNLSIREIEVIRALAKGETNKEVAEKLKISEKTVKFHLTKIFLKTGLKNRSQLVYACSKGLLNESREGHRRSSSQSVSKDALEDQKRR